MTAHQAWLEIGKLLIEFGEIYLAKNYINEALKNFKILNNTEAAG